MGQGHFEKNQTETDFLWGWHPLSALEESLVFGLTSWSGAGAGAGEGNCFFYLTIIDTIHIISTLLEEYKSCGMFSIFSYILS